MDEPLSIIEYEDIRIIAAPQKNWKAALMPINVNIMTNDIAVPPVAPNRLVAVLAYDGLATFEFGIAVEIFGLPRPELGPDWYRFVVCAAETGILRAAGGVRMAVDGDLDLLSDAGTIIVPGWRGPTDVVPEPMVAALRKEHARGARLVSICSGAFVLAAAGVLAGKRATTHWRFAESLALAYPDIRVEPDILYVDEGDVMTSAGSAAGIDLCLHIVRQDFGPEAANHVARRLVVPPHREGGQAQFIERPVSTEREGARLGPLLDSMRARLAENISIDGLAVEAGMSLRTFLRRFHATTGTTPGEWLLGERIQHAKELLETTPLPIDEVAARCGFGSAATLRHHFRERLGASPVAYRKRFARV